MVVGSLAHQADRWSDIDLEVVVADDEDLAAITADWVGYLYELLPVVHHFERAFGGTLVRGFLLENLLELDLAFERAGRFSIWGPARVVFDRSGRVADAANALAQGEPESADRAGEAGFAWHDVLHACTAVRRGRSWQGVWYLERVRNRTLEQFAMSLDYVAPCAHGRLLRRSQKEDSGSRTPARHGQERGCSHLRGESFLGQTLRQSSSRRTLALSGEGTRQATEAL